MNTDDGRCRLDITHDERDGGFDTANGNRHSIVAGLGIANDAFESEDAEVAPASGKVGVGQLLHGFIRHRLIIRLWVWVEYWYGARQWTRRRDAGEEQPDPH